MGIKLTSQSDTTHVWPDKPVQLNRQTAAWIGLFLVTALGLGLNLGLRQFSGQKQPTEQSQAPNLYVQATARENREDYSYKDLTKPPSEQSAVSKPSAPSRSMNTAPDPLAEARRREDEAARQSGLFPQGAQDLGKRAVSAVGGAGRNGLTGLDLAALNLPSVKDLLPGNSPSAAERRKDFMSGGAAGDSYLQHGLQKPLSAFEIKAGTVIPSALITGINSDLPGEMIDQVTENVYDTATGQHLLIPQGAKIFGRYNADITYGQNRAQIVWDRLILPNGSSLQLKAMVGTDKTGYAGLADQVDHHTGSLFGAVLLSSLITAGANLVSNSDDNSFTEDLGDAAAQQAVNIGGDIVDRQLDVVRPEKPFNILNRRDSLTELLVG